MKNHTYHYLTTVLTLALTTLPLMAKERITSPNGKVVVGFQLQHGKPTYTISIDQQTVIQESHLGYELQEGNLDQNFQLKSKKATTVDETWKQIWGEEDSIRNHYNELQVNLEQKTGAKRKLQILFRVYNDGVAFRYIIPQQPTLSNIHIVEEKTEMTLAHDADAWSIPTNHTMYLEGYYRKGLISQKDTVCTPLTIAYQPHLYLSIHEAGLTDYASLNLTPRGTRLLTALTPWSDGIKVKAQKSVTSPWRTLIFGKTPGDLITNRVMLNLNEPCQIDDPSWIKPGRYIGIWWSIHKKQNTWEMGPKHGATTANVKRYIDFAAQHGFSGVLSEGWNPGWGKGEEVSYLKSYPDFDIQEVNRYAQEKGIKWIGHMESWGHASLIEQQMEDAFSWYHQMGMNAVKTGYVGNLLDGKELNRSQYGVRHYRKVIETAAKYHIMIDNHEPVMPTGLQRTYPNLMTQEGVRGQEYNAWSTDGGNTTDHTCILPFTRGLAGPMDYTPAIFNFSEVVKGTHPHTTLAKQLAEFVILYSPLQMAADQIEHYQYHPALSFIESCPTTWSKTIVPNGEIGQYLTIARQERDGENWFLGSITNSDARELTIDLGFLDANATYQASIYEDAPDADYENKPLALQFRQIEVRATDQLHLKLARSGGVAIRFMKIK